MITVKVNPIPMDGLMAFADLVGPLPRMRVFRVMGEVMTG